MHISEGERTGSGFFLSDEILLIFVLNFLFFTVGCERGPSISMRVATRCNATKAQVERNDTKLA